MDELPGKYHAKLAVVSGPSFAKEIGVGLPTSVTCAAHDSEARRSEKIGAKQKKHLSDMRDFHALHEL